MIEAKTLIAARHVLLKDLYTVVQYIENEWESGGVLAQGRIGRGRTNTQVTREESITQQTSIATRS